MTGCCSSSAEEIDRLRTRQSSILKIVLGINVIMFLVEVSAGLLSGSTALLADSLDMLADALVYGFSLYVVARSIAWKAAAAMLKGAMMAVCGLFVLGQAVYKLFNPAVPHFATIGIIGLAVLAANSLCLYLLWAHRQDDVNMRSVWLCSRNDIIANVSVLGAAAGVWLTASQWPDLFVGLGIALLFLRSAGHVVMDAIHSRKEYTGTEDNPVSHNSS
jgi:cation diffusion facilitator family transporter